MLENILLPFYLISAFSTLASALNTDEEDNQHEFGLCPESHPTAFDSGSKCCFYSRHDNVVVNLWWNNTRKCEKSKLKPNAETRRNM